MQLYHYLVKIIKIPDNSIVQELFCKSSQVIHF
jgi:hypothetical protein